MPIHFSIGFVAPKKHAWNELCASKCDPQSIDAEIKPVAHVSAEFPNKKGCK